MAAVIQRGPDWVIFQPFLLCFLRFNGRHHITFLLSVYILLTLPGVVYGDRTAFIEAHGISKSRTGAVDEGQGQTDDGVSNPTQGHGTMNGDGVFRVSGFYSRSGPVKSVEGRIHSTPGECGDTDEKSMLQRPRGDWVAVFNYGHAGSQTDANSNENCQSVIDRVKRAMLFGASAVIILALNPKIIKELDVKQMFINPVVFIQEVENVTVILGALVSKIKLHVKLTYNTSYYDLQVKTVSVWSSCMRTRPGSGVICFQPPFSHQVNPSQIWSYFYSAMSMLLLLFIIKAKQGSDEDGDDHCQVESSLQRLAGQALSMMQVKRYRCRAKVNHNDSERDTCAVCLDVFYIRQRIRVLPCLHEFHTKCVDPWLIQRRTCPLCKLNIIDDKVMSLASE